MKKSDQCSVIVHHIWYGRDHYVRLDSKLSELRQNQLAVGLDGELRSMSLTVKTCHSCGYNCILGGEVKKRYMRLRVLASEEGEKFCRNVVVGGRRVLNS